MKNDIEKFIAAMGEQKISCRHPIFKPLHHLLNKNGYPNTDKLRQNSVSIPIYPTLTKQEQDQIINSIKKILKGN